MGATGLERGAAAADGDKHRVESAALVGMAADPGRRDRHAARERCGADAREPQARRRPSAAWRAPSAIRTGLTGAAVAMTVLAARTGSKLAAEANGGRERSDDDLERDERRVRVAQWMVPALTGAIVVMDAFMGEQQRPHTVVRGVLERVLPDTLRAA